MFKAKPFLASLAASLFVAASMPTAAGVVEDIKTVELSNGTPFAGIFDDYPSKSSVEWREVDDPDFGTIVEVVVTAGEKELAQGFELLRQEREKEIASIREDEQRALKSAEQKFKRDMEMDEKFRFKGLNREQISELVNNKLRAAGISEKEVHELYISGGVDSIEAIEGLDFYISRNEKEISKLEEKIKFNSSKGWSTDGYASEINQKKAKNELMTRITALLPEIKNEVAAASSNQESGRAAAHQKALEEKKQRIAEAAQQRIAELDADPIESYAIDSRSLTLAFAYRNGEVVPLYTSQSVKWKDGTSGSMDRIGSRSIFISYFRAIADKQFIWGVNDVKKLKKQSR